MQVSEFNHFWSLANIRKSHSKPFYSMVYMIILFIKGANELLASRKGQIDEATVAGVIAS